MFRKFLSDVRGNFAMLTGIAIVPILGGLALAIDYVDMSRQRQDTLNALDAANMATARRILDGASDAQVRAYAREFFNANLGSVKPEDVDLEVILPANISGGGRVKLIANLRYDPVFLPPFQALLNRSRDTDRDPLTFNAESEVQLKNTVEVALVLDNSGSMDDRGKDSGKKRIDLLKDAAKQLVDQIALQGQLMKQVERPVQFAVVPFAASVNVGTEYETASWMDTKGQSSIHYENFNLPATVAANKQIKLDGGYVKKMGSDWKAEQGDIVTRFSLFRELKVYTTGSQTKKYTDWQGCVESRPGGYNLDDTTPTSSRPDTLFVPMFAPDEFNNVYYSGYNDFTSPSNNWWRDSSSVSSGAPATRQRDITKYFAPAPSTTSLPGLNTYDGYKGPNYSCTTTPITPLTDVTKSAGLNAVKAAINAMKPLGATNVPEGLAWGWRVLSSTEPFAQGRPETERGNDKVVIVLTDGANTYYTQPSDLASVGSTYSAYGFAGQKTAPAYERTRIYANTSGVSMTQNASNYTTAMNQHFTKLCENANGGDTGGRGAGLIIMTVALDLDSNKSADSAQIGLLQKCASRSRYAKDPNNPAQYKKLFWNATSGTLSQTFKEIADELSNLRFVG